MNQLKRQLFLLKPKLADDLPMFDRFLELTREFSPMVITPEQALIHPSLDGNVLLIPSSVWPEGALSDLTRFVDLLILALLGVDEDQERVALWYVLGATQVLDETASPAVLKGSLNRLLDVEVQSSMRPQLTRIENLLFEALRGAGRRGLDRAALAERIWENVSVQEKTIDVHIFNLRRKLNSTRFRVICEQRRFAMLELANSEFHAYP